MASSFFEASQSACQEITKTFDMVWALDAGLWNLRQDATEFFVNNPGENNNAAKSAIVKGLYIHGLNLERIAHGYTWEQEEEFISEILLINATAIFDAWVDDFVCSVYTMRIALMFTIFCMKIFESKMPRKNWWILKSLIPNIRLTVFAATYRM